MASDAESWLFVQMRKLFGLKHHLLNFLIIFVLVFLFFFTGQTTKDSLQPFVLSTEQPVLARAEKYIANIEHYRLKEEIIKTLAAYDYNAEYVAVSTAKIYRKGRTVHCHYFDKHRKRIPGTSRQVEFFDTTTVLCPKSRTVNFSFVDLSFSSRDLRRYSQPIPLNRSPEEAKTNFAVCLKLDSQSNWLEIVQFIEWHRKIGFTFFYLTTLNLDEYTRRIVDDYIRLGLVHLTSLKTNDSKNSTTLQTFQTIQKNNCDLRARVHSKWFIHLGLNEKVTELPKTILPSESEIVLEVKQVLRLYLEKFKDEEEIRRIVDATEASFDGVVYRKLIRASGKKSRVRSSRLLSSSSLSPFPFNKTERLSFSVVSRASYIYKTRPLYCDEIDTEILSWCPVWVYHCEFRDAASEKAIMKKREEIQKNYTGIVYTW